MGKKLYEVRDAQWLIPSAIEVGVDLVLLKSHPGPKYACFLWRTIVEVCTSPVSRVARDLQREARTQPDTSCPPVTRQSDEELRSSAQLSLFVLSALWCNR